MSTPDTKSAIYGMLYADATIFNIVGDKIFPQFRDSTSDAPAICFERVSLATVESLTSVEGPRAEGFSIFCYGSNHDSADALRRAVIDLFEATTRTAYAGVTIIRGILESDNDDYDLLDGQEMPEFLEILNYKIWVQ